MLDISQLEKIDIQKMYAVYDKWPQIALESYESNQKPIEFAKINHIVFAGMGGSGAIGDMFSSILSKTKIHVDVVKGYELPQTVDADTVVVCISVSGNTSETLSIIESAHKLGCKIIAFSSGGRMQEYCTKNQIEYRFIKQHHSPRASFTSFLYTILKVLRSSLGIKESDVIESISQLQNTGEKINSLNLNEGNFAVEIAKWINGIPVIYYPYGLQSAAIRFKNSLQENSKMHVITEDVIEVCHNGIVAWEKLSNANPILIQGQDDHIKTKERWDILEKYFLKNNIRFKKIVSINGSILSKLINLIYLLDFATIYKSVLDEVDPSSIKSIEYIKSQL